MGKFTRYVLQKLSWYVLAFFIALFLNFLLPRLVPGDPISVLVSQMMSGAVTSEAQERVYQSFIQEFGLDKPFFVQFFTYIKNVFQGNLGTSFSLYPLSVNKIIADAIPWTLFFAISGHNCRMDSGKLVGSFCCL